VSHHGIAGFCFYLTQNQHGKNTISNKNQIKEEKILKGCMVQIYTVRTTDYKKRFQIYGSTLSINGRQRYIAPQQASIWESRQFLAVS
jgi:hypothetical protein